MSTATLTSLLDYLCGTLSPNNMRWVGEHLFAHRKQTYRSLIVRRLNKIVYYVKGDTLHIAAFWDTRREPKSQARQTK